MPAVPGFDEDEPPYFTCSNTPPPQFPIPSVLLLQFPTRVARLHLTRTLVNRVKYAPRQRCRVPYMRWVAR